MRLIATVCTWRDGEALDQCLQSLTGVVDGIVLIPGPLQFLAEVDAERVIGDDYRRFEGPRNPPVVTLVDAPWPTLADKRNAGLANARHQGADWVLAIDADEQLHNGDQLRATLAHYPYQAYPIAFISDDVGKVTRAPWKVYRADRWWHVAQSSFMRFEAERSVVYQLEPQDEQGLDRELATLLPHITHHPERRPQWRQVPELRLGHTENTIEPAPDEHRLWKAPSIFLHDQLRWRPDVSETPAYYCDQCGERYLAPGICVKEHPPVVVVPLPPPETDAVTDAGLGSSGVDQGAPPVAGSASDQTTAEAGVTAPASAVVTPSPGAEPFEGENSEGEPASISHPDPVYPSVQPQLAAIHARLDLLESVSDAPFAKIADLAEAIRLDGRRITSLTERVDALARIAHRRESSE
jgi:hypothetical protein